MEVDALMKGKSENKVKKGKEQGKDKSKEKSKRNSKDKTTEGTSDMSNVKCFFWKRHARPFWVWLAEKKTVGHQ